MRTLHSSPLGGHSGQLACVQRIKPLFYWPHMKQDVIQLVRQCDVCQRNKPEHVLYPGLPQPLPIPQQSWSHISMDFIEKLPLSDGKDTIMVVVDRLTKFAHFITLSRPFSATTVAHVFLEQIFKLHGLPASIVSDRDTIFTSIFWQTIFKTLGVSLHYSTAYHPQSDGQTERVNQCLETYLRCFTCDKPTNWSRWIPMAEYWYNTSFHTSLAMTPFEALYGVKPVPIPLGPYVDSIIPAAVDMVQQHAAVMQNLKEHLVKAQHRIKQFADLHRSERTFQVGDMVFLKLQPYKQQTTAVRACLKLCSKLDPMRFWNALAMSPTSSSCLLNPRFTRSSMYHCSSAVLVPIRFPPLLFLCGMIRIVVPCVLRIYCSAVSSTEISIRSPNGLSSGQGFHLRKHHGRIRCSSRVSFLNSSLEDKACHEGEGSCQHPILFYFYWFNSFVPNKGNDCRFVAISWN